MQFRVVTVNLEQDHKRWSDRHPLISAEITGLRPDVIAFNEVSVPLQRVKLLLLAAHPRLAKTVFEAFCQAKGRWLQRLRSGEAERRRPQISRRGTDQPPE